MRAILEKSVTQGEAARTTADVERTADARGRARAGTEAEALVARAVAGDAGAQRELMLSQRTHVHHTLFRIMGSNRDMEDLMQETFIEIFRALPSYRAESSLRRWCATIATRTAWRALDRRRRMPIPQPELAPLDETAGADERLDTARAWARLYQLLERLDPRLRVTFALAAIDGRSMAEVAELTGASIMSVKTRLWRARAHLAKRARHDPALARYVADLQREAR